MKLSGTVSCLSVILSLLATQAAAAMPGRRAAQDAQSSLTLDPSQVQAGLEQDGQEVQEAGQVPSATSTNNFINFCLTKPNLPLTNGLQIKTGSCNPTVMGVIISQDKMPGAKFVVPVNGQNFQENTAFDIQLSVNNMETGNFVNAQTNYFAAPQDVNGQGLLVAHSHVTVQLIPSITSTDIADPTKFAFFKGLNAAAQGGILTASVAGGLPAGTYRVCSMNTAANHQPAIVAVAQHGFLDDCVYFTVGDQAAADAAKAFAAAGNLNSTSTDNANAAAASASAAAAAASASAAASNSTANADANNGKNNNNNGKNNNANGKNNNAANANGKNNNTANANNGKNANAQNKNNANANANNQNNNANAKGQNNNAQNNNAKANANANQGKNQNAAQQQNKGQQAAKQQQGNQQAKQQNNNQQAAKQQQGNQQAKQQQGNQQAKQGNQQGKNQQAAQQQQGKQAAKQGQQGKQAQNQNQNKNAQAQQGKKAAKNKNRRLFSPDLDFE